MSSTTCPIPSDGLLPAILEQAHLLVPARERRDRRRVRRLVWAACGGGPVDLKQLDRLRHAFDFPRAELGAFESAPDQAVGRLGAQDLARDGHIFQPNGDVPCLAHHRDRVVLRFHDGRARMDADPRVQLDRLRAAELPADGGHVFEKGEPRCRSSTGRVLEGDRVAEADEQSSLVALHDRPLEPSHGLRAGFLERSQHADLIFRVELQVRLGIEQVAAADEHRQLTALGLAGTALRGTLRRGRRRTPDRDEAGAAAPAPPAGMPMRSRLRGRRLGNGQEQSAQVFGEVGGRGVAILLSFRERLETDTLHFDRDVRDDLARRLRLVFAHLPQKLQRVVRPERHVAGEHLVEDDAEAVDVGPAVDAMGRARSLLGRHVARAFRR